MPTAESVPRIPPGTYRDIGLINALIARGIGAVTGTGPPNLFTTLSRHRRLYRPWLWFARALMPGGTLPRMDTELVVLRAAHNCGCDYERRHHERLALRAGLRPEQVAAVGTGVRAGCWTARQELLLRAADELHTDRTLSDELWQRLTEELDQAQLIELPMLVGHYEMLAMTLNSLRVRPDRKRAARRDRSAGTDRFTGRTAIVTGAASGIGREIARQFAARGAIVLVTDLDPAAVDAVVEEITARGGRATGMVVDVTDRDQLTAAVDDVVARHGSLDYMVNNAGVAIFGDVDAVGLDDWDTIIDVNLRGVAYGTTIAYRRMVAQGGGHIVNTASVAGLIPVALQTHYCTTKHAIVGMCRTMRLEAAEHNVRITAFCPAWVESGMFDNTVFLGSIAGADARRLVPVRPMPTERAVTRLIRGLDRGAELVITPGYGRWAWWLERWWPTISHRVHRVGLRALRARSRA